MSELPSSEHFFIERCDWRVEHQYTVTAKEGVPSHLRHWMPSLFSTVEGATIGLADAEAYYDEQAALAAHYAQFQKKPMSLLDATLGAMDKILGES